MRTTKHARKSGVTTVKKDGKIVGNIGRGKTKTPKAVEEIKSKVGQPEQPNTTANTKSCVTKQYEHFQNLEKPMCKICGQRSHQATHEKSYNHRHRQSCPICRKKINEYIQTVGLYGDSIVLERCQILEEGAQAVTRAKANYDAAERAYLIGVATEDTKELDKAIDTLHSLPEENKPKNFKDKDVPQLTEFFLTARKDLREKLPGCVFETNDNNQIGKDLTCVNCGKQVELKSGPDKTDANNGVGLLTKITGINNLDEILSPQDRRGEHDEAKIKESKKKSMRELGKKLDNLSEENKKKIFDYACAVSYGFTKEPEILDFIQHVNEGKKINDLDLPTQLMFTERGNLTEYSTPFIPGENFTVLPQSGDEGRSFLRVTGEESERVATIYPNYKNSWGKDENKQQAGDWVSSPSFQVLIK